jgi:SH3 domain-containing YSC84-like protein 1
MKRKYVLTGLLLAVTLPAAAQEKEEERVQNAGTVMKEILAAPDSIPQSVLDKAECVVVLPSVKKFAIGIGGSYGQGVMTCRGGKDFTRKVGRANDDGARRCQRWFAIGRRSY